MRIAVGKRKTSNHEAGVLTDLASLRREDQVDAKKLTSEIGILCINCTLSLLNRSKSWSKIESSIVAKDGCGLITVALKSGCE